MLTETDLELTDGRTLHIYDSGVGDLAVFWHHGTPNTGEPPEPLFPAADRLGIRWISHDRPGYMGSTPQPDRDIAAVAGDVKTIADALGMSHFAVMGHSGGGPHALGCAALLPDRVLGVVCISGLAPYKADGLDWSAGMAPAGATELRAAAEGRAALEHYFATHDWDPETFTPADHAALADSWAWLGGIAGKASQGPPNGMVDDNLAYVRPWGFDPSQVVAPTLFLHGGEDRIGPAAHAEWLSRHVRGSELWLRPDDGHISVLNSAAESLGWLREHARQPE